jgi:SNF2 family DNA or RNA helicase
MNTISSNDFPIDPRSQAEKEMELPTFQTAITAPPPPKPKSYLTPDNTPIATPSHNAVNIDIRKMGATRVLVTVAQGSFFSPSPFADYKYASGYGSFHIPLEESPKLYTILSTEYKHYRFTIDPAVAFYVRSVLERERKAYEYAVANDAPEVDHVLGPITLRPFQAAAFRYMDYNEDDKILALDMGLGKTAVAIKFAESRNYRTIFLTKASLVQNLDAEIRKLTSKRPVILSGRVPDESCMKALLSTEFQYFILNYEVIGTELVTKKDDEEVISYPWVDFLNIVSSANLLDFCPADEAHSFKNMNAKRTKAILKLKIKRKMPMTGTPLVNRIRELFPLLHWVAPDMFPSEQSFLNTHDNGNGFPKNPKALQKALLPYMFRRAKKDVLTDLPPITRITHSVDLSPLHKERYKAALEMVYKTIDGGEKDIQNTLVQLNRLREIVADAKADASIEYLNNFLEETDEKIIVFSNFKMPAKQIAVEMGWNVIHGDIPMETRMGYVNDFNNNPSTRGLVLTVATGQEGLNLTAASTIYFNDLPWTPKDITQGEARAYGRLVDLHGATSVWAQISNTVDALILSLLMKKMAIFESAVDGTAGYATEQNSIMSELIDLLKTNR